MACINRSHPEILQLAEELNVSPAVVSAKVGIWQSKNNILDRFPTIEELDVKSNNVNQSLKAIEILSFDKAIQIFEKGKKSNWDLNKILTELQIPKEQKQLILDNSKTTIDDIITDLLTNYSYTVDINTTKQKYKNSGEVFTDEYGEEQVVTNFMKEQEVLRANTSYYSNLTVPGGTNYTENEIATPAITPSIKGHAQFATNNGIGWFRSDDKTELTGNVTESNKKAAEAFGLDVEPDEKITTKTRRILEVQSDLFQKGRDKKHLGDDNDELESLLIIDNNSEPKGNNFLQLLNKDNNWVTFFVKSIIQDSVKKGYEKVLFPVGDTAAKIEGHETVQGFIDNKENRLKELKIKKETYINTSKEDLAVNYFNPIMFNSKTVEEQDKTIAEQINQFDGETKQLEKEIEDAESGKLKISSIANFYETTIKNILDKTYSKDKITKINDEYGNGWYELNLDKKRDLSTIYFKKDLSQFESEGSINEDNKNNIIKTLNKFAKDKKIKLSFVDFKKEGVNDNRQGDYDSKKHEIRLDKNRIDPSVMLHEISHPFVTYLNATDPKLFEKIYNDSKSLYPDISEFLQIDIYNQMPESWQKEEYVVRAIEKEFKNEDLKVKKSILKQFLDFIKDFFNISKNIIIPEDSSIKDLYQLIISNNVVKVNSKLNDKIARRELEKIENYFDSKIENLNSKLIDNRNKLLIFKKNVNIGDIVEDYNTPEGVDSVNYKITQEIYNNQLFNINDSIDDLETQIEATIASKKINQEKLRKSVNKYYSVNLSNFESEENESIFTESILQNRGEVTTENNSIVNSLFPSETTYTTVGVVNKLESLFRNNNDPFIADVLSKLTKLKSLHNVIIKTYPREHFQAGVIMQYESNSQEIQLSTDVLRGYSDSTIISSLLHELTHHITVDLLNKSYNKLTLSEKDFVDTVNKFYKKYESFNHKLDEDANFNYGFETVFEFVSEFYGNPDFREYTKTLSENWFQKFIKAITDSLRQLMTISKSSEFDNLYEKVFNYIENSKTNIDNLYVKNNIFAKIVKESETYDLTTINKKLEHLVLQAQNKVKQLIDRTKKSTTSKATEFLESFKELESQLEFLSGIENWKAIISYVESFNDAVFNLNKQLDSKFKGNTVTINSVKYTKISNIEGYVNDKNEYIIPEDLKEEINADFVANNVFIKDSELYNSIENEMIKSLLDKDYLDLAFAYEDYLSSYDLLPAIKQLISDTKKDYTLSREDKQNIELLIKKVDDLSKPHGDLLATISKLKKESAIKLFANTSNNKKIVKDWQNKLGLEYDKLTNPTESKLEWVGYQLATVRKEEFDADLLEQARKIIENPYTDITSFAKNFVDLLNINSPLINIISNVVGKMRDLILQESNKFFFEIGKVFDEYSLFNDSLSMSKKYGNLVELNTENDTYYLKGKYSTKFKESYIKLINSLKDVEDYKSTKEYKQWFVDNTKKDKNSNTIPNDKYLNKPLNPAETKALNYFIEETKNNHKNYYADNGGLVSNFFGAEYYQLPSKTKIAKERTYEGDIKGQIKDKYTDLTQTKVDDIHYGQAFDSRGDELKRIQINYRGKIDSKDQSLDLFSIYRNEGVNAITFKNRSSNENKLKLFLDISRDKDYKRISSKTNKWAKNVFGLAEVAGQTKSGSESNELAKIKGILETALYDTTSYESNIGLGKFDGNKLASLGNSGAAFIGMTLNIGSATVNNLNGQMFMLMERFGSKYITKNNLTLAESNYTKSLSSIFADISNPVKKSFHNQMLNMFDIIGMNAAYKQDFINNSTVKELMSLHNANFLNEGVEHMLNSVLTESILRSVSVMNKDYKYIDKDGNVTSKENAASIFDMLYMDKDGILKIKDYFKYSEYNLVDDYHVSGKQSLNYLIKKQVSNLYGVYDPSIKAEISKTWYGKLLMMFKNYFLSQANYRYKGMSSVNKSKDELTDEDITFNNAEQEYTEGIYVTLFRTLFPLLRGFNIQMVNENFKNLSDYERANIKKAFFEISMTAVLLPILGAILATGLVGGGNDDDDKLYFLLFAFRKLESEMSQFRNLSSIQQMISNPFAANRFYQNAFQVITDLATPINLSPKDNESTFDWFSENNKGENKFLNHTLKLTFGQSLNFGGYQQKYNMIDSKG